MTFSQMIKMPDYNDCQETSFVEHKLRGSWIRFDIESERQRLILFRVFRVDSQAAVRQPAASGVNHSPERFLLHLNQQSHAAVFIMMCMAVPLTCRLLFPDVSKTDA